MHLVFLSRNC